MYGTLVNNLDYCVYIFNHLFIENNFKASSLVSHLIFVIQYFYESKEYNRMRLNILVFLQFVINFISLFLFSFKKSFPLYFQQKNENLSRLKCFQRKICKHSFTLLILLIVQTPNFCWGQVAGEQVENFARCETASIRNKKNSKDLFFLFLTFEVSRQISNANLFIQSIITF